MPDNHRPLNQPRAGHAYRLCAIIAKENAMYVRDFEASQDSQARSLVNDARFSSAMLFDADRRVVARRIAETDGDKCSDVMSGYVPEHFVLKLGIPN